MSLSQSIRLLAAVLSSTDIHVAVTTATKLHIRQSECSGGCERCTLARQHASWPEQVPFICYSALSKTQISILIEHFRRVDKDLWYETKGIEQEEEEGADIMTQVAEDMERQGADPLHIRKTFEAYFDSMDNSLSVPSDRHAPQPDGRGSGNPLGADVVLPAAGGGATTPMELALGLHPEHDEVLNDFMAGSLDINAVATQETADVVSDELHPAAGNIHAGQLAPPSIERALRSSPEENLLIDGSGELVTALNTRGGDPDPLEEAGPSCASAGQVAPRGRGRPRDSLTKRRGRPKKSKQ